MKKTLVLIVLFILPLVAYLFFASGVNNFGRLPTLSEGVVELPANADNHALEGNITVLGFLGEGLETRKGNAFNLNQKIYKRFSGFKDFQFVMLVPKGTQEKVAALKKELGELSDASKWHFVYADSSAIVEVFESLGSPVGLDADLGTSYVYIIDKDRNLRGRDDDIDDGVKFGFDSNSVAELNNKMEDDVKIILAEYRLALKQNNADRSK
ncbi:MAG: hypothetical protein HRT65_05505 [Flavobacteriaceae bacterium]|nr:hypothetical protein [Flavobacteriaceae bacterium]